MRKNGTESDHFLAGDPAEGILFVNGGSHNICSDAWRHREEFQWGLWYPEKDGTCTLMAVASSEEVARTQLDMPGYGRCLVSRQWPESNRISDSFKARMSQRARVLEEAERKMKAHHGARWPYIRERYMAEYARIVDDALNREDLLEE